MLLSKSHIPRSWFQKSDKLLVIFEETEKTPFDVTTKPHFSATICGQVSENHYPALDMWSDPEFKDGKLSGTDMAPIMILKCEDGYSISSIECASYRSQMLFFALGNCPAPDFMPLVSQSQVCPYPHGGFIRIRQLSF